MKPPDDAYDLDTEIAKHGGRISPAVSAVDQRIEAANSGELPAVSVRFNLDVEIAKYGGHLLPQPSTQASAEDPFAVLRKLDPSSCEQISQAPRSTWLSPEGHRIRACVPAFRGRSGSAADWTESSVQAT
jgi:hypothetical protein